MTQSLPCLLSLEKGSSSLPITAPTWRAPSRAPLSPEKLGGGGNMSGILWATLMVLTPSRTSTMEPTSALMMITKLLLQMPLVPGKSSQYRSKLTVELALRATSLTNIWAPLATVWHFLNLRPAAAQRCSRFTKPQTRLTSPTLDIWRLPSFLPTTDTWQLTSPPPAISTPLLLKANGRLFGCNQTAMEATPWSHPTTSTSPSEATPQVIMFSNKHTLASMKSSTSCGLTTIPTASEAPTQVIT